jgi:hypothetical protein
MNFIESFFALLGFFGSPFFVALIGGLGIVVSAIVGLMFILWHIDWRDVVRGILLIVGGVLVGGTLLMWATSQHSYAVWG